MFNNEFANVFHQHRNIELSGLTSSLVSHSLIMSHILFLVFEILSQKNCCIFKARCFEGVSSQKPHREHETVLPSTVSVV